MRIRFDAFTLDTDTRQLGRGRDEVHLSPKAFDLLVLLVEHRPRALAKTELLQRLWPNTFVSEENLPTLIHEIRRALGDDSRAQRFVRTLHRFGYAFSGAANDETNAAGPPRAVAGMFWIVADTQIALREGENLLGREPGATVWFDRPGVSRRHARITVKDDQATLEDLGSRNGTFLRGQRLVAPATLHDGDEVRLGPVSVTFRVRRTTGPTETQIAE